MSVLFISWCFTLENNCLILKYAQKKNCLRHGWSDMVTQAHHSFSFWFNSVEFCQTFWALYFMFRTLLFYVFIIVGQLTFLHESPAQCYLHLPFPPPSPFFNRRSFWSPRSGTPAMQASSSCFDSMTSLGSGMRCWIPPQTLSTLGSCGFQGEKEITRICHRSRCAVTNWVDS